MDTRKGRILVPVYIAFLFMLFEGGARLALLIPPMSNLDHELNWRRLWISSHKPTGIDTYFGFDTYDPTKGWISKPNITDMIVFDNKVLNTNSRGFRGKNEYTYKDQGLIRMLVLGDSFTFGDGVSDNETYPHYLQEMIPYAEITNLGIHGYGHDQMLILLQEETIDYKPDIVILGFLPMDMERNVLNFRDYAKPKFVLNNNQLMLTGTPVPSSEEITNWDWARPRMIDLFSIARHRLRVSSGQYASEMVVVTTAILLEIIQSIDRVGAIPVFVYLPYANEISDDTALTHGEKYFFDVCKMSDDVRCFSTRRHFAQKLAKGLTFNNIGHWEATSHLTAAEAIQQQLMDNGYLAR